MFFHAPRLASTLLILLSFIISPHLIAGQVTVAVAANFTKPMQVIVTEFEKQTAHRVTLAIGSTGKLYAQIRNGAPYDLLLSADQLRPEKLLSEQLAVPGSAFTYAKGRLILWSSEADRVQGQELLADSNLKRLAIANPKIAPYGAAAIEALKQLNYYPALQSKIVEGQNISQTYQFVSTGNARQGLIALSQVSDNGSLTHGSGWIIPPQLHQPLKQDAILLKRGAANPVAKALLAYLGSDSAKQIIRRFGYDI